MYILKRLANLFVGHYNAAINFTHLGQYPVRYLESIGPAMK